MDEKTAAIIERLADKLGVTAQHLWGVLVTQAPIRELTYIAKYEAMPRAEWDGEAMLYSEARDQYYSTPDDAADELEEDQTLADLRLVICEPNYVRQLEPDYCCDELPEDGDVPDEVAEAMEAFNSAVAGIVLSWSPGKKALALPDEGHNSGLT